LDHHLNGEISPAIEAALFATILGAWTAFETLAGDLGKAVNFDPKKKVDCQSLAKIRQTYESLLGEDEMKEIVRRS